MSEPPDRIFDNSRFQSPTESLSNRRTSDHCLSPNEMIISTPTDLDSTESVYEYEYLEDPTPTDLDTTSSVTNISIGSMTITAVENEGLYTKHRHEPGGSSPLEMSIVDDSVDDPNYAPHNEGDRTRTLSDISMEAAVSNDNNIIEFRTSTPVPSQVVEHENINPDIPEPENNENFSKSEKRFSRQLEKRAEHIDKLKKNHPVVLSACSNNCSNKCLTKFSESYRLDIYNAYWGLDYASRRKWLASCVKIVPVQRRRVRKVGDNNCRKKESRHYVFQKNDQEERVCLSFFLKTLGYSSDSVITELRKATKKAPLLDKVKENRGRKMNTKICNYTLIEKHINSYHPCVAHYRRHNTPNARYLSMGLTLKDLYSDFKTKHPNLCSIETYRKALFDLGVSLHKPQNELCVECTLYSKEKTDYQENGEEIPEEIERKFKEHYDKAKEASEQYKKDKEEEEGSELKIYSMDLEKVILLPIMPKIKDSFFVSRLVVFNETFASLKPRSQNYCCVWHEAIAGRDAPQIIDSLLAFLKEERDVKNFVFWADNCVGQNKNWYLYTALVTIVNTNIAGPIQSITFKYLTKGHTHMTADAIHGNVEQTIKKKGDVYDFKDMLEIIKTSRRNLNVVEVTQFHKWPKKKRTPRRYNDHNLQSLKLHDVVEVKFSRGSRNMLYKESFKDRDYKEVNFLQFRFNEKTEPPPEIEIPRGISKKKKEEIINKLVRIMPANRADFWRNLTEKENVIDLVVEGQMECTE